MATKRFKRKAKAQKEGNRLMGAIRTTPMEGMAYKVTGENFEMLTNQAAPAMIAARAIEEELGIKTHLSLGSQVLLTGSDYPRLRRRNRQTV